MNPLGRGNSIPPQIARNIQQIKQLMQTSNMTTEQLLQRLSSQNPAFNQVMQMCKGQNPEQVFYTLANNMGVNPNEIINALK